MVRRQLIIRVFFAALALLGPLSLAVAQPQQATDPEDLLQYAEQAYEQLEYEAALNALVQVLQTPGTAPIQRVRAFLYMGVCFTALGNAENAVQAFVSLLQIKPDFRLPETISPSIKAMFREALRRLNLPETLPEQGEGAEEPSGAGAKSPSSAISPPGRPVRIAASASPSVKSGEPVDVKIEVEDPQGLVRGLVVRWRLDDASGYSSVKVRYKPDQGQAVGRVPGVTVRKDKGQLAFYVEALGGGGITLAHAGSMDRPLVVTVEATRSGRRRWAWWALGIGSGLAVVGGVVAAVLLTRPENGHVPNTADVTIIIK